MSVYVADALKGETSNLAQVVCNHLDALRVGDGGHCDDRVVPLKFKLLLDQHPPLEGLVHGRGCLVLLAIEILPEGISKVLSPTPFKHTLLEVLAACMAGLAPVCARTTFRRFFNCVRTTLFSSPSRSRSGFAGIFLGNAAFIMGWFSFGGGHVGGASSLSSLLRWMAAKLVTSETRRALSRLRCAASFDFFLFASRQLGQFLKEVGLTVTILHVAQNGRSRFGVPGFLGDLELAAMRERSISKVKTREIER